MFGLWELREEVKALREAQDHHNEMLYEFNTVAIDISKQLEFCNHLSNHMQKIDGFAEVIDQKMKNLNKMIYEYKKAVDMERKLYKMEKERKDLPQVKNDLHRPGDTKLQGQKGDNKIPDKGSRK